MDRPVKKQKSGRLKKLRESLPGLLIESVLITLGVLLAIAADNWRAQLKLEKDTFQVLENIQNELIGNRGIVLEWLGYYDSLTIRIGEVIESPGNLSVNTNPAWFETLYPSPTVSYLTHETAWQTAQSTQVLRNFQYNTTFHLTHAYRYQNDIDITRQLIFQTLHQRNSLEQPLDRLHTLSGLCGELTKQQQYLLGTYRDALIALDQEILSRKD